MKNAIVTGATKGIGKAISKILLNEGYHVTATYAHDKKEAEKCKSEFLEISNDFEILKVNQQNIEDVEEFAQRMLRKGHIDCIILNAGITYRNDTLKDITDSDWEDVMMVNINSNVYLIRDLFDVIPNNSRIIFISSLMGIMPHSMSLAYGVSKSAVIALAKNMVKYFEGTNTTVNTIAPGFVETEWQKNKPKEIRNNIINKTAIKRFAEPEEIAEAVRFCINNPFINGSVLEITGGYSFK